MALSANEQVRYWGIGLVVLLLVMWMLGNVLLPFITGMAIAYFLDPVADKLEAAGTSRSLATTLITAVALVVIVLLIVILVPLLVRQTSGFVAIIRSQSSSM